MNKREGISLAIIVFLYLSCAGQYTNNGIEFGQANILAFINILIISIVMMVVPLAFRLKNKDLLEHDKGIKICLINSIIIFILSMILYNVTGGQYYIGLLSIIAFYFVNIFLFVKPKNYQVKEEEKNIIDEEDKELKNLINNIEKNEEVDIKEIKKGNYCTKCGEEIDNEWIFCNYCGNKLK